MFWGHTKLAAAINSGTIAFDGRVRSDGLLLTLSGPLQSFDDQDSEPVDLLVQESIDSLYNDIQDNWARYTLPPSSVVLVQVGERLSLKGNAVGLIGTLSHLARCRLMAHLASPFVGPSFDGFLTLEVFNAGSRPLTLSKDMPIAKVMLAGIEGHSAEPNRVFYGSRLQLASRYALEFSSHNR